jgi:threonine synthase
MPTADKVNIPTFVTNLECSMTGETFEADRIHGLSPAGRPLLVRYDLDALANAMPTNGNPGAAMAVYANRAGIPAGGRGSAFRRA